MADTPDWLPAALARLARAEAATVNARRLLEAAAAAGLPEPHCGPSTSYPRQWVVEWMLPGPCSYLVVNVDADAYYPAGSVPLTDPAAVVAAVRRWLGGGA